jgi:hypothetical protein
VVFPVCSAKTILGLCAYIIVKIWQIILIFDKQGQVLQVLRKFDIFMTAAQFDDMLLSALKLPKASHIDYMQFLDKFSGAGKKELLMTPRRSASMTQAHSPRNLNMFQAKAERARLSLERVSKTPQVYGKCAMCGTLMHVPTDLSACMMEKQ